VTASVIEIDRLPVTFMITGAPDRAELVWRRARDALASSLSRELASCVGTALDDDDAYMFIDRVDVACSLALDGASDGMTGAFAAALTRELLRSRDQAARVYRDRAEYLSAYLAAAVDGSANGRWWFGEFDGLAAMPVSSAIRTLLTLEPATAWQALGRLTPGSLVQVIGSLAPEDTRRVLADLSPGPRGAIDRLVQALARIEASAMTPEQRVIAALANRGEADAPTEPEAHFLLAVAALRVPPGQSGATPTRDDVAEWCRAAALDADTTAQVLQLDPRLLAALPTRAADAPGAVATDDASTFTPFGGAILLLARLARSGRWHGWRAMIERAGAGERTDLLANWLALAVVARALVPADPRTVEDDAALRRVTGIQINRSRRPRDGRALAAYRDALGMDAGERLSPGLKRNAADLIADFAASVPGCAGSTPTYVRRRLLAMPASVSGDGLQARLGRAPLDVLLSMAGLKRGEVSLPDGRRIVIAPDLAP
jgi:hypothetical protein